MYCDNSTLLSSTESRIYDKDKHERGKVIILYKSGMDSNIFLFDPADPKIGLSQFVQAQVVPTYVQAVAQ